MNLPSIRHIGVSGLHGQYDISLPLDPGLNVIYGKNGKGKTTLLHILANVLEQDFSIFTSLQFNYITIETHAGDKLEVLPHTLEDSNNEEGVILYLNQNFFGFIASKYTLTEEQ